MGTVDDATNGHTPLPTSKARWCWATSLHLNDIIRRYKVDEVIMALREASDRELEQIIEDMQDETVSIKVYPDAFQLMTEREVSVGELSGLPLLSVKDVALRGWNRRVKRVRHSVQRYRVDPDSASDAAGGPGGQTDQPWPRVLHTGSRRARR